MEPHLARDHRGRRYNASPTRAPIRCRDTASEHLLLSGGQSRSGAPARPFLSQARWPSIADHLVPRKGTWERPAGFVGSHDSGCRTAAEKAGDVGSTAGSGLRRCHTLQPHPGRELLFVLVRHLGMTWRSGVVRHCFNRWKLLPVGGFVMKDLIVPLSLTDSEGETHDLSFVRYSMMKFPAWRFPQNP